MAQWSKGKYKNPKAILDYLKTLIKLEAQKGIQHSADDWAAVERAVSVLGACIDFNASITTDEKRHIVRQALQDVAPKPLEATSFQRLVAKHESKLLAKPVEKYTLVTSLSVKYALAMKPVEVEDCSIRFSATLPPRYSRKDLAEAIEKASYAQPPTGYCWLRVRSGARSAQGAVDAALDAIDLLRGVWNLFYNQRKGFRISPGRLSPINDVLLGPIHTLHSGSGTLASEGFWWEPGYIEAITARQLDHVDQLYKYQKQLLRRISRSSFSNEIREALRSYARALDERTVSYSFTRHSGRVIAPLRAVALARAIENDTANPWSSLKARAIGQVLEVDVARAILREAIGYLTALIELGPRFSANLDMVSLIEARAELVALLAASMDAQPSVDADAESSPILSGTVEMVKK